MARGVPRHTKRGGGDPSAGADESHQSESTLRVEDPDPVLVSPETAERTQTASLTKRVALSSDLSSEISNRSP